MPLKYLLAILNYHLGRARYLLIHIPKNAGVAIKNVPSLRGWCINADPYFHVSRAYTREVAAAMHARGEHHGFQHARLRDIHPSVRARLQPVAIIRNPWARVVSRFRFGRTAVAQGRLPENYLATSFEGFLEERSRYGGEPFFWHRVIRGWYPQLDYVTDASDRVAAHLLRFEHLDDESMRYFGLSTPPRKRNVSTAMSQDWRGFYTARTIEIVADWYKRDIAAFGFDFDTAARRGTYFTDAAARGPTSALTGGALALPSGA
ncbi:MAG: hypothetical protein EXQ88_00795 [Alphaproteobacteria bacterium]|nr:hypothetical protein [Alphaproteobacteria bacterium]